MVINSRRIQQLVVATAFASSLLSLGVAASAQTIAASAATTTSKTTNVSMSTINPKATRRAELEQANADARRVEFRNLGTSL